MGQLYVAMAFRVSECIHSCIPQRNPGHKYVNRVASTLGYGTYTNNRQLNVSAFFVRGNRCLQSNVSCLPAGIFTRYENKSSLPTGIPPQSVCNAFLGGT
jgi:hypothetical protein